METTLISERMKIWKSLQEQKQVLDRELSVEYDPKHRLRNRILMVFLNLVMKMAGTNLRVKYNFGKES